MEQLCRLFGSCCLLRTSRGVVARTYAADLFRSCTDFSRIVATQFIGAPLYWFNSDLYYAYMALTKQSFGIFVTTLTQWWAPTPVRVSGDASVAGQIKQTEDGRVELNFPGRVVLIGNHQVRTNTAVGWQHANIICLDILRLALLLVGRLHEQPPNARPHLHHPKRILKLRPCNRVGDEVLRICVHVSKDGDRSTKIGTQVAEIEDSACRTDVWNFRTRSDVAFTVP